MASDLTVTRSAQPAVVMAPAARRRVPATAWLVGVLVVGLAVAPHLPGGTGRVGASLVVYFAALFAESLPFLLAGALLSGLLGERGLHLVSRLSGRHPRLAAVLAPLMGVALPLCDCGLVPLARRLQSATGQAAVVNGFVAGAPLTNPIVVVSTLLAFPGQPLFVAGRFAAGVVTATAVAALARPPSPPTGVVHSCATGGTFTRVRGSAADELADSVPTLVVGCLLAAAVKTAVPTGALESLAAQPLLAAIAMMGLAFVMSLCSQADAFVAAALPVGALPRLAFLVLGPSLDLKTAALYRRAFGGRWLASYAATVVPAVLVVTTLWATWVLR